MVKILRTFNIDDDVAHMLRFKKKNQSRFVNSLLRNRLFQTEDLAHNTTIAEAEPKFIVSRCFMYTKNPLIISALNQLMEEVENNA